MGRLASVAIGSPCWQEGHEELSQVGVRKVFCDGKEVFLGERRPTHMPDHAWRGAEIVAEAAARSYTLLPQLNSPD